MARIARDFSTHPIDTDDVMEHQPHHFTAEASELGLPVGVFPQHLKTTLGNGQDFYAYHDELRDGDRLWVDYHQGNGCIKLRVYND